MLGRTENPYLYNQEVRKPFEKPKIMSIQEYANFDQMGAYQAKLADYLSGAESKLKSDNAEFQRLIDEVKLQLKAG